MRRLAQCIFAAAVTGLGLLELWYHDFVLVWEPVPDGVPGRAALAAVSAAILLAGGIGLAWRRTTTSAAGILACFFSLWLLLLQVPRVWGSPGNEGMWCGLGETAILVTGSWTLFVLARRESGAGAGFGGRTRHAALIAYGLALPMIGLSHFFYATGTAGMIPAWIPLKIGFAYLTGAGHVAAGIGIVLGICRRLAAVMEAAMLSCFVLLLHVPGVLASPRDRLQLTMLCIASAYVGCAWTIAASLRPARAD